MLIYVYPRVPYDGLELAASPTDVQSQRRLQLVVGYLLGALATKPDTAVLLGSLLRRLHAADNELQAYWEAKPAARLQKVVMQAWSQACDAQGGFIFQQWLSRDHYTWTQAVQRTNGCCLPQDSPLGRKSVHDWRPGDPLRLPCHVVHTPTGRNCDLVEILCAHDGERLSQGDVLWYVTRAGDLPRTRVPLSELQLPNGRPVLGTVGV